jgi:hypothetical protein
MKQIFDRTISVHSKANVNTGLVSALMKRMVPLSLLSFGLAAIAQVGPKTPELGLDIQAKLVENGSNCVAQVEIYRFPEDVMLGNALRPDGLERAFWTKTTIRQFEKSPLRKELIFALARSFKHRSGGPADARWGCVLYNFEGKRIVSIYLDQFGAGQVDGTQVSTDGKLLDLLRKRFSL